LRIIPISDRPDIKLIQNREIISLQALSFDGSPFRVQWRIQGFIFQVFRGRVSTNKVGCQNEGRGNSTAIFGF
jgi:hypothetical protein